MDFSLPDGDGLDVLRALKAQDASLPVVLLTGHGTIDLAVQAIKEGAEQFLTKPVELPALLVVIERGRSRRAACGRSRSRASRAQARHAVDPFFGESPAIRKLAAEAARVARRLRCPILIQGETGTGKGVLARWLHRTGPARRGGVRGPQLRRARRASSWRRSCSATRRAPSPGAVAAKQGLLEMAHRGTLFLDEIGDVDLAGAGQAAQGASRTCASVGWATCATGRSTCA